MYKINIKLLLAVFIALVFIIPCAAVCVSTAKTVSTREKSVALCLRCLQNAGFEAEFLPELSKVITLPEEFDEVYLNYNRLQNKQGYDMLPYAGKTVEKYVFCVHNFPGYENTGLIFADVYLFSGKIIGGDINNVTLNGFMIGLNGVD